MRIKTLLQGCLTIMILVGVVISAASTARAEGITPEQADQILNELKQIRQLLQQQQTLLRQNTGRRAAPPDQKVKLKLVDTYALGSDDAPVTLVEFTDYQCPYCSKFHQMTFPQIKKNYIDTGKIRFVSRDLPLDFHKNALQAARATRCAGEQNKYWEIRHVLGSNPKNLGKEEILKYALVEQLNLEQFQSCFESDEYEKEINQDIADAHSVGITGTPGFVLGRTSKNDFEGIKIKGAFPYSAFAKKIDKLLNALKKEE